MRSEQKVTLAISGCGDLTTRTLLPRFENDTGRGRFALRGFHNPRGSNHRALAERFEGARAFDDYAEMLDETDAEAVLVLSPAQLHAGQALAALRAGKHVYVQKPVAADASGVDALVREAAERGLVFAAAPVQAAYPTIRRMAALVGEGKLGTVYFATAPFMGWSGMDVEAAKHPGWRYQSGDGPLRDHGIYSLVTLISILGRVESVCAFSGITVGHRFWQGERIEVAEDDNTAALLRFENGALVSVHEAWCPCPEAAPPLRIFGLGGVLETFGGRWDACPAGYTLFGPSGQELERVDVLGSEEAKGFDDGMPNPHVWCDVLHFAGCITGGAEPAFPPGLVRHVYDVIDAVFEAASTGVRQRPGARVNTDTPSISHETK